LGLFSIAVAFFGLLTIFSGSGLPLTVSRKIAEYNAYDNTKRKSFSVVTAGLLIALIINAVVVGVFLATKSPVLSLLSDQRAERLILIMLPATFSTCIYNVIRAYFMGKKKYGAYSITELIEEILNVIIILTVLFLFVEIDRNLALPIAFTIADVICFIIIVVIYFLQKGKLAKPIETLSIFKSSTPITLMRLFTSLTTIFTAVLLPNRLMSLGMTSFEATAEFGRATGMAYPLLFAPLAVTSSLSIVLLPEIAEKNVKADYSGISYKLNKSISVAFIISCFFFIVYAALGTTLGKFLFADEKAGAFVAFSSAMVVPLTLSQITNTTLNSLGKEKVSFVINVIALAVMIVGLYFLPKYLGIYALAVSQTAFHTISFIAETVFLSKYKVTDLSFYKTMLKVGLPSLLLTALTSLLFKLIQGLNDLIILIICGAFAGVGYLGILFCLSDVRSNVSDLLKRKKIKRLSHNL